MRQALPEHAEANQLRVRDGLRPVTKRATPPPAGLLVDERAAEEQHQAQRSRLSGESRLMALVEGCGPASSAIVALALALSAAAAPAWADGFPVSQVVEAIKSEINLARLASGPEDRRLKITSVAITLTAVARAEGEGGIALEVPIVDELVGGADARVGAELASTQKIALTLVPLGAPEEVSGTASLGLAPAIESVKAALRAAARGPLEFGLDRFVFEAEFAVTKSAGGGVRFLFIDVAKAAVETVAVHHAAVHFELAD